MRPAAIYIVLALGFSLACGFTPEQARAELDAREASFDHAGFMRAIAYDDLKLVEIYLVAGMNVNDGGPSNKAPLALAVRNSNRALVRALVEAGARAEELPDILLLPARRDDLESLSLLLAAGAAVDAVGRSRKTAMLTAIQAGAVGTVELLIAAGADLEFRGGRPLATPLIAAAMAGNAAVVDTLLAAGADPGAPLPNRLTPADAAERKGHDEIAAQLRAAAERR